MVTASNLGSTWPQVDFPTVAVWQPQLAAALLSNAGKKATLSQLLCKQTARSFALEACKQSTLIAGPRGRNVSGEACASPGDRGTAGIICHTILAPSPQGKQWPSTHWNSVSARLLVNSCVALQVPLPMLTVEQLHKGITTSADGQSVSVYGVCTAVRAISSQIYSRNFKCGGCEAVQQTSREQLPHSCCPESAASSAVLEEDLSCRVQEQVFTLNDLQALNWSCHVVASALLSITTFTCGLSCRQAERSRASGGHCRYSRSGSSRCLALHVGHCATGHADRRPSWSRCLSPTSGRASRWAAC